MPPSAAKEMIKKVLTSEGNRSDSGPRACSNDGFSLDGEGEADRPDAWTRGKRVTRSCALLFITAGPVL